MTKKIQRTYTEEEKENLTKRMISPSNTSVAVVSRETGISESTLNGWKQKAIAENSKIKTIKSSSELSSKEKFLIVIESYTFTEVQLAEYCRSKGLYVEQIRKWRESCITANGQQKYLAKDLKTEMQQDKKKINNLEKELHRKDRALAETTTLLVLRKKLDAILGEQEEE